jgi:isopenicillin N synthase-like dioxygenase
MTTQSIPVVDLRDWRGGSASQRQAFAQTLGGALREIGFFALSNHGVDATLIQQAYHEAEGFFDLSVEAKLRYEDLALKGQRGYTSYGRERAKGQTTADLKEFWHVGQELSTNHPLLSIYGENLWPKERPRFRPVMLALFHQLESVARLLLEACAVYLKEPSALLQDAIFEGDSILRVIHYPPVPEDANPVAVRAAAHEDINFITLLCESTSGGLEIKRRDGSWLPVHALQGQLIVDSGDMLQHLTNGVFKSTTHRVVNPNNSRVRRFSMPFFVHPRAEVDLTPLPSCVANTGGVAKFPSRTARQYLEERLSEIGL